MIDFSDPATLMIVLVVRVIIMIITGIIANHKGRNILGWVMLAFLVEIIALIIVACLPNLKTSKDKEARIERENRRLREQLRQEQIKGESFRQHTTTRLDAHDGHLGVDTRHTLPDAQSAPAQLESMGGGPGGSASLESTSGGVAAGGATEGGAAARGSTRQWHYEINGETHGPIDESQLMSMVRSGAIRANTLLWTEELGDWKSADSIKALRDHLQA